MTDWYMNGEPVGAIGIESRGLQYGDGVFETVAVRNGKPRLWSLHIDRLTHACNRLGLDVPNTGELQSHIERQSMQYGTAKIIVAAKAGPRGYARPASSIDVLVRVFGNEPLSQECYGEGVDVTTCETSLATGSVVAGLKTLNRIEQVLARNEVVAAGSFEGLTRDPDGRLICGTMSNLFAVKENQIITPDLTRCGVEGVMRRHIIEILSGTSQSVTVTDLETLQDCEEVFLSNSQFGVLPVRSCDGQVWPVGETTRHVAALLAANGVQEWSQ